jgi:hypothetical protein
LGPLKRSVSWKNVFLARRYPDSREARSGGPKLRLRN